MEKTFNGLPVISEVEYQANGLNNIQATLYLDVNGRVRVDFNDGVFGKDTVLSQNIKDYNSVDSMIKEMTILTKEKYTDREIELHPQHIRIFINKIDDLFKENNTSIDKDKPNSIEDNNEEEISSKINFSKTDSAKGSTSGGIFSVLVWGLNTVITLLNKFAKNLGKTIGIPILGWPIVIGLILVIVFEYISEKDNNLKNIAGE